MTTIDNTATQSALLVRESARDHTHEAGVVPHAALIIRNILTLGGGQVVTWICASGMTLLLPRALGDANLGKMTVAFTLTGLFGLVISLGIGPYLTKAVARDGTAARDLVLNALVLRIPLALAASGLAYLSATLLGYDGLMAELVLLSGVSVGMLALANVLTGALNGIQKMQPVVIIGSTAKILGLALVALFFLADHPFREYGLVWFFIASIIADAFTFLASLWAALQSGLLGGRLAPRSWLVIIVGGIPFLTWESALLVYGRIDMVLLPLFATDAVVGWYAAAYRVIGMTTFVPAIMMTAVFPALSSTAVTDRAAFIAIARRSLQIVLLAMMPIALGIMLLADKIVALLGYPESFSHSVPLIVILAIQLPLVSVDMIIGTSLNALGKQRRWAITGVVAAVLNPALNLAFIPATHAAFGNGAIGAAIVTVLTEIVMMGAGLWLLHGEVFNRESVLIGVKSAAAGLVMAGVVWVTRELPFPLTVALGCATYLSALPMLGGVTSQDFRIMQSLMLRRARSLVVAAE
jgi:O-antigen/teichoic acid export membrane protein